MVRQLLTESKIEIDHWRQKLLTALGSNGQLIIDVIPEIKLIIGEQPSVPELGLEESQNRFSLVIRNFIRAFCSKEHPLVFFLDDLQWADLASLKLIQLMMSDPNTNNLFLIAAYRDNEVGPSHPLLMTLGEIRHMGETVNQIKLKPLGSRTC